MGKELLSPRQAGQHVSILVLIVCSAAAAGVRSPLGLPQPPPPPAPQMLLLTFLGLSYILCGTTSTCLQLNVGK